MVLGTAGDRTDEAIHAMGAMAAQAADRLVVAGRVKYLRGREPGEMEEIWRAGAAEAGVVQVDESVDEQSGLIQLLDAGTRRCPMVRRSPCARWSSARKWSPRSQRRGGAEMTPTEVAARVGQRAEPTGVRRADARYQRRDMPAVISRAASRSNCP